MPMGSGNAQAAGYEYNDGYTALVTVADDGYILVFGY